MYIYIYIYISTDTRFSSAHCNPLVSGRRKEETPSHLRTQTLPNLLYIYL